MLLGEHEHTIDDKNRLTLPARFRAVFAEGVVLTRGMDGCLNAYRRDDWEILVESRLAELDPLSQEGRRMQRFFFSGAIEGELDKQGRVMIPAALIKHGGLGRDVFVAGGHAAVLSADLRGDGRFIAIDRDPTVRPYFEGFRRHAGVQSRFLRGEASVVLDQLADNGARADAILLDLGVSSMQIDRPERGFSYAVDAPLDMRMDPTAELTAADLVNEASEGELTTIFRKYGEERYAKQIARAIGRERKKHPIERTGELVDVIRSAIPAPARFGDGHPAKRVFQALRIAVNDELGELEEALPAAMEMLRPGGRLAVIAFHSLEDRIVKRFFQRLERGCVCPPDFPVCVCGREPELRRLNRKAIRPSAHELALNPRAASARLRVVQKT